MERIPIAGPWITEREIDYVGRAVREAWYDGAWQFHERFETAFATLVGVKHAVSTPSCTTALHIALKALGVGPGDEVIVPDLTWIASVAPVTYVGATPRFADVDPATWCIDVDSAAALLTPRTKAIVAVDLYGSMPDMRALRALAEGAGLPIVEDAAEALGSTFDGRPAGSFGRIAAFSFHASKTVTTGEGGMAVTDDRHLYERLCALRNHGRRPFDRDFSSEEIGFKYMMSSMQAALGLAQVERAAELVAAKRRVFHRYATHLSGVPGLSINAEPPGTFNSFWMASIVLDETAPTSAPALREHLRASKIDARPFFPQVSRHPAFQGDPAALRAAQRNRTAAHLAANGLNLPSGPLLTDAQIDRVCGMIASFLARPSRAAAS
ncbi:MAG: DegT/DnrJ/EryC1/StrS family aminotransferase [Alphaproteobacteria bacterium]|nr:DegT/DnrJ/EryC1/StrS family aminotransferase [Alphaproteobacteria bacterium]